MNRTPFAPSRGIRVAAFLCALLTTTLTIGAQFGLADAYEAGVYARNTAAPVVVAVSVAASAAATAAHGS